MSKFSAFIKQSDIKLRAEHALTLDVRWIEMFGKWTNVQLICDRCNEIYNDIENIGSWNCKQHARQWNAWTRGEHYPAHRWDCCGEVVEEYRLGRGCVSADHRPKGFPYQAPNDDVVIPELFLEYLVGVRQEAILSREELTDYELMMGYRVPPGHVVIRRYNTMQDQSRKSHGKPVDDVIYVGDTLVPRKNTSWYGL